MSETSETLVKLAAVVAKFKGVAGAAAQATTSIQAQTVELAGGGWITTKEGEVWKPDEHPRNAKGHFVKKTAASFLFGQTKKAVFNKQVAKTVAAPSEAPKIDKNISADTQVKYDLGPGDKAYHSTMGNVAVLHPDKSVTLYTTAGSVKEYAADDPFVQKKVLPNIANGVSKLFDEDKTAFEVPAVSKEQAEDALHSQVKAGDKITPAQMALLPRGSEVWVHSDDDTYPVKKADDHGWVGPSGANVGTWKGHASEDLLVEKIGDGKAWQSGPFQSLGPLDYGQGTATPDNPKLKGGVKGPLGQSPEAPTEAPEAPKKKINVIDPDGPVGNFQELDAAIKAKAKVTTHLQGIGQHEAKAVSDLKPGDTIVYNYGSTSTVKSVTKKTPNTYTLVTQTPDGKEYTSTKHATTLLGYQSPEVQAKAKAIADKINAKIDAKKAQAKGGVQVGSTVSEDALADLPVGSSVQLHDTLDDFTSAAFVKQPNGSWKSSGSGLEYPDIPTAKGQELQVVSLPEAPEAPEAAPEAPKVGSVLTPAQLKSLPVGTKAKINSLSFTKQGDGTWKSEGHTVTIDAKGQVLASTGTVMLHAAPPKLESLPEAAPAPAKTPKVVKFQELDALPTGSQIDISGVLLNKQPDGSWQGQADDGAYSIAPGESKLDMPGGLKYGLSPTTFIKLMTTQEASAPEAPGSVAGLVVGSKPSKEQLGQLPTGSEVKVGSTTFIKEGSGVWSSPNHSTATIDADGNVLINGKPFNHAAAPTITKFGAPEAPAAPPAAPSKPAPVAVEGKKNKLTSYNPEDTPEGGGSYTPVEGTKSLDDILSEKGFKHPVSGATFHLDAGDSLLQHKLTPTSFAVIGADGTKKFQVNSKGKQYKWSPHVPKSNFKIIATPTQELGEKPKEPETPHAVTNMQGNTFTHPVSGLKVDIKPGEKLMQHNFTPNSFVVMDDQGNMLYKIDVKGKQQKAGTNLKASNYFEAYNGTTGKAVNTPNKPVEFEKGKFQPVTSVLMKLYEANDGDTVTTGGETYTKDGDNWKSPSGSLTAAQAASAITIDLNSSLPEGTKSSGGVPLQPTKMKSWLESQPKGTKIKTSVPSPSGESYTVEFTKDEDGNFTGHSGGAKLSQVSSAYLTSLSQAWPDGAVEGLAFEEPPKKVTNDYGVPVHDTDQMKSALDNQPVGATLSTSFVSITKNENGSWSTGGGYPWQAEDLAKLVVDYQPSHKAEVKFTAPATPDQLSAHGTPIGTVQALQTHLTAAPVGTIVGINATRLKKINSKEWRSIDEDGKFVTNSKLWSNDDLGSVLFKKVMKTELKTEYPATPVGKVASKVSAAKAKKAAASKVQPTKTFESVSEAKDYTTTIGDGSAAKEMASAISHSAAAALKSWEPVNPFDGGYEGSVTQAAQPGIIAKLDEVDANLTAAKAVEGLTAAEKSAITKYQKKVARFKQLALAAQQMSVGNLPDPPLPDDIYNFNWGNSVAAFPFNMGFLEHGLKLKQAQLQFKASLSNLTFDPFDGTAEEYGSYLENTPHKDLVPYLEQSDLKTLTLFHLQAPGHTSLNVGTLQKKAANTQYQKGVSAWLASQKAGEPLPLKLVENPSKFPEKPDYIEDDLWDNIKFALSGEFVPPAGMSKAQNLSFIKVPEQAQVAIEQAIGQTGTYVNTGTRQKLFNHLALSGIWYKDDLTYESPVGNFPLSPGMAVYETDAGSFYFLDKEKKEKFQAGEEVYTTYYNPHTSTFSNSYLYPDGSNATLAYTAPYKVTLSDSVQDGHSFDSQAWQSLESFEDQTAPRKLTGQEIVALKKTLDDRNLGAPSQFSPKAQTIMVDRPDLAEMVAYKDVKGHYRVIDTSPPVKWADLVKEAPLLSNVPDVTKPHNAVDAIVALQKIPESELPAIFKAAGASYDPTDSYTDSMAALYGALKNWNPVPPAPEEPVPTPGISGDLFKVPASALKLPGSGGQTKTFFVDADGVGYLGKPNTAKKFRADSEQAAGDIGRLFGFNVPESTVRTIDGEYTHLQRITNASGDLTGVHPDELDDASLISVMQGHVLDWTVSNHDSHGGNYLRSADDGSLVKIDLGQAWKALGQDKLEVGWELPGNFGEVWYNSFYKGVQSKKISKERLDLVAKAALVKARRISFTNDDPFRAHLEQAFANRTSFPQGMTKAQFIDLAMKRKQDTFGDFFDFYKKLYSKAGYDFPFTEESFKVSKLDNSDANLALSQDLVDEAAAFGSFGKSLFFDSDDVEDAHVLLFATKNQKGGKNLRGDMQIRPDGGKKVIAWLKAQGFDDSVAPVSSPKSAVKTLPGASNAFDKLVNLAKTTSKHAGDGQYNTDYIAEAKAVQADLKISLQKFKDELAANPLFVNGSGPYAFQTGHQQQAWMAWAEDMIGRFDATFEAQTKGEKSPKWSQEEPVYDPPADIDISGSPKPVETVEVGGEKYTKYSDWNFVGPDGVLTEHEYVNLKSSPGATTKPVDPNSLAPESTVETKVNPFKVKKVKFSIFTTTKMESPYKPGKMIPVPPDEDGFVTELDEVQEFASNAYEVTSDDHPGITIQYVAHNETSGDKTNPGRLQFKIENFNGDQSQVEAALNMVRQMGVQMDEADETSMEVFFWKHMYGGLKDREALRSGTKYEQTMLKIDAAYKANPKMSRAEELVMLKDAFRISMGDKVVDNADYRPRFNTSRRSLKGFKGEQTGRPYWLRPDFDVEAYKKDTSSILPTRYFANTGPGGAYASAIRPFESGGFLSNEERTKFTGEFASAGAQFGSSGLGSPTEDRKKGGSSHTFLFQGWSSHASENHQFLEPWVAARTHSFATTSDSYGAIYDKNTESPFDLRQMAKRGGKGGLGTGELDIKYGFSAWDDLAAVWVSSSDRKQMLDWFDSLGITEIRGIPVSERIVSNKADYDAIRAKVWQRAIDDQKKGTIP